MVYRVIGTECDLSDWIERYSPHGSSINFLVVNPVASTVDYTSRCRVEIHLL
jgi:hypothetical protein